MTVSSSGSALSVNGLVSGINTQQVIQALLQSYQVPITDLQNQQSAIRAQASDYQTINTDMQAVLNAAQALSTPSAWDLMSASTSSSSVATATSSPGATPGSITFSVGGLAQGNVLASVGGVSSESQIVTTAPSFLVATGAAALGLQSLGASGSLALGAHTLTVDQSSQAASVTGSALGTITITAGSNDTVNVSVDGTSYTLTLAAGTYTPSELAAIVTKAVSAAGAPLTASVTALGQLQLSTSRQGSAATISITGGDGVSALGLTAGQSGSGVDAVVSVDGTKTTLSSVDPGQQVTLAGPSGSIVATVSSSVGTSGSLLSAGSADAAMVSSGNGSLADVITNINAAGLGATASAVQLPSGNEVLQVAAQQTGLAGSVSVDSSAFAGSPLGGFTALVTAQDASVTVGGSKGYTLTSSTNTFSDLLAGTSVTVAGIGQATVTVQHDAAAEAGNVGTLVSAANQALADIHHLAGYDASTKTAGPLMGSAVLGSLEQQILSIVGSVAGTSGLGNATAAGLTVKSDGTLSFDTSAFEAAYAANPAGVQAVFTQGATFSPLSSAYAGQVSLAYAGNQTPSGSYDVTVSHSATQATDLGASLSGGSVSVGETLDFAQNGVQASYTTTAGETLTAVAAGLNQMFAAQGLSLSAAVVGSGTQLQVTSNDYGSAQTFQVTSTSAASGSTGLVTTAGSPQSFGGTDVAGTIDGQAATGTGQVLAASATGPLDGLSALVTVPGITSTTDLGSLTYSPGVAQQLATAADSATNVTSGSLTATIQGLTNQAAGYDSGIAMYQQLEASQQTVLQNEFANMEATLGVLKNESSMLANQINQLPGF